MPIFEVYGIQEGHSFLQSSVDITAVQYDYQGGNLQVFQEPSKCAVLVIGRGYDLEMFSVELNNVIYSGHPAPWRRLPSSCKI